MLKWARYILCCVVLAALPAWIHGGGTTPPDGVCNIVTGVYTGVGGTGTCNSTLATCNGSADDAPAFASFNTWATGTWQVAHPGLKLGLNLPGNCTFVSSVSGNPFANSIKRLLVSGIGGSAGLKDGGGGFFLAGQGMFQDNLHSARIATVAKGATSIALVACPGAGCAAAVALFNVGDSSIITGVDMQGPGSSPPNPAFWDWITINCVSTTLTCSGGNVGFTEPLTYAYKSTWPLYDAGGAFAYDQGGPGTIYAIHQSWNTDVEYQNLTIDAPAQQTQCIGRSCTLTNVVITGGPCVFPTQTKLLKFVNDTMTLCSMEVDKMIDTLEFDSTPIHLIAVQSASVKNFVFNHSTTSSINGLFLNNTFTNNSVISSLSLGVGSQGGFGAAGAVSVSNTEIDTLATVGNIPTSWHDINLQYTMSGGVISIPANRNITSATNNGSGLIRLTVDNSSPYTTGKEILISAGSGCVGPNAGTWIMTLVDGTHIDLQGSTAFSSTPVANTSLSWSAGTVTVQTSAPHGMTGAAYAIVVGVTPSGYNGGTAVTVVDATHYTYPLNGNPGAETVPGTTLQSCFGSTGTLPAAWAIPGANLSFKSSGNYVGPIFQVTGLRQDANFTYVDTSLAGGFPTVPLETSLTGVAASATNITVHPAPKWNSVGATGDPIIVDLNNAGAQGLPIGSYSKRTITSANGNPASAPLLYVFGPLVSLNMTVGTAYTGSTGTMTFNLNGPLIQTLGSATETTWNFGVNAKTASATPRVITPTGSSGSQLLDTLTPPGANTWLLFNQNQPVYSSIPGDFGATSTTIEVITNQGVVYPYLLRRDIGGPANDNRPVGVDIAA